MTRSLRLISHRIAMAGVTFAAALVLLLAAPSSAEAAPPVCGDGFCTGSEKCDNCPGDCGACAAVCPNAVCEAGETCSNCTADCGSCPPVCGDASCDGSAGEDCSSCAADCGVCAPVCGDATCDASETCSTCTADCGACATCGDTVCDAAGGEDCTSCAADCGACVCGDGTCQASEDCTSCVSDCGACSSCGDGTCDLSEDCTICSADCGACSVGEVDFASCPYDLPACTNDSNDCCYRSFGAGSIIVPMDRCHQTPPGAAHTAPTDANAFCGGPTGGGDDGMFQAYGLAYRMMQANIPVYWIINPTKDPPPETAYMDRDIDTWVLSNGATAPQLNGALSLCGVGCVPPVLHMTTTANTLAAAPGSYKWQEFPTRGAAFIIAREDRVRFNEWWTKNGSYTALAGDANYDFSAVEMFEVQNGAEFVYLDFRGAGPVYAEFNGGDSAPVATTLDFDPPRLARESPAGVSSLWLAKAKLLEPASNPQCLTGSFDPETAVYCDVSNEDMQAGYLIAGNFDWAWLDNWNAPGNNCAAGKTQAMMRQLEDFMTAIPGTKNGSSVMFMDNPAVIAESCAGLEPLGNAGGLAFGNQKPDASNMIIRYAANLFIQFGDVEPGFSSGSAPTWNYSGNGYKNYKTMRRLLTEDVGTGAADCQDRKSSAACDSIGVGGDDTDFATYARFEDDPANGVIFYMGGNNISQNGNTAHLRMVLNSFLSLPTSLDHIEPKSVSLIEVTRSSPIVATVGGIEAQYQGTIDIIDPPRSVTTYSGAGDDSSFQFPHFSGHFRAVETASLSAANTDFDNLPALFDAASEIPPASPSGCAVHFTDACRTIFTNIATGAAPDRIFINTGNVSQLGPLLDSGLSPADGQTLISRILAGRDDDKDGVFEPAIGGIDRSTVAVIETSPNTGGLRPTIAYVGGLDGMIHAFCAQILGPCTSLGQELWAYLPRTQLPLVRKNLQRFDGSPKVSDVFGDFDGNGTSEFRTVMTFQIGSGNPGFTDQAPAVIAMDITKPTDPRILWEYATPATRGAFELGKGLGVAMGPVRSGNDIRHYTFAQTNNGGTGGSGFVVVAFDTVKGTEAWRYTHAYKSPPRTSSNPGVPVTGIPGGVSGFSNIQGETLTHVLAPSLYGDVWLINTETGLNQHGSAPLFTFLSDFHPIGAPVSIFVDQGGKLTGLAVSGGYADPVSSQWSPDTARQYAVAFPLDATSVPIDETSTSFTIDLGVGNRAFAQALVIGSEIFIVTDSTDINAASFGVATSNTGMLQRHSTSGAALTTNVILPGGAGSVDATATGVVFSGSGKAAKKDDFSGTFNADGKAVELRSTTPAKRGLWISR